jgi:hypothetical protein
VSLLVLAAVVVGSSVALGACAVLVLRLPLGRARVAGAAVLEFAGLWTLCLVTNVALGAAAIVLLRHLAGLFISIYALNDLVLVVLSALQAAALWAWLTIARPGP